MGTFETIQAAETEVRAYTAGPDAAGTPGVVLLHAWWGLDPDLTAYADRLGGAGFAVLAPDFFEGRTASTPEQAETLATSTDEDRCDVVALGAADALAARLGEGATLAVVGFSFGAAWALWLPAKRPAVGGTVVYYGSMTGPALAAGRVPVLGHFAADDPYEPPENVAAMETQLRGAGREVTVHRYPGTGHWFAEPSKTAYVADAAELAWERTLAFLRATAGAPHR